jgi:NitT/TauT family transport system substrate-binding protein
MRYIARHNLAAAAAVLIVLAAPAAAHRFFAPDETLYAAMTVSPTVDMAAHPLYSAYKFERRPGVVNIGVQPFYLPVNIIVEAMKHDAVLKREMEKAGIEIRFYNFLKGADLNFFLLRGDLQSGFAGDMPALVAASRMKIKIPALAQMGFTSIVSQKHRTIKDLRGGNIGCALGSNAHYALLTALAVEGMSAGDVRLVPMEINDMPAALASGRIDAFAAWEPTVEETLDTRPRARTIHRTLSSGYLYFAGDFYSAHPDAVRAILAAEIRAVHWLQRDEGNLMRAVGWAAVTEKSFSGRASDAGGRTPTEGGRTPTEGGRAPALTRKQTAALAAKDILGMDSEPRVPMREISAGGLLYNEFEFLKEIGEVPQSARWRPVAESFDSRVMDEILANPSKYRVNEYDYR